MTADDRSGQTLGVPASAVGTSRAESETQSATFDVGALQLELTAAPGAASLIVSGAGARDTYVVEPAALSRWATAVQKLLRLEPMGRAADRVEFRAPFLVDRDGRASISCEGLVTASEVSFRLLVTGADDKVAGLMTTREVVGGLAEAAAGAVLVAQRTP